ncbi:DUF1622 domain-containing protein [Mycolicibacterium brumae]|uniref:DUF1622 domain-containing protein n=1 Tax=Mycolicibacterium brumae TaxID=85968 RepID=A0A2G5PD68_9MYCO|nr:DUF1622 domain-containing protein [Mycolicibacterium brumae]MCV7191850.1 DUF1622 domain-containing protein [Mycolicibacterium brumae]PIB76272.1 DUF1622 domain-containing protein [Mycolicibacterium brumae]RWA15771.1 hypothetical protein MBRU_09475 [Mycolicibacterium brumae DSM 44177]UWW07156.1 DUF1622 domain-containing protein [Mycolicibacterium brumae]
MQIQQWAEISAQAIELAGVGVIALGAALAAGLAIGRMVRRTGDAYVMFRRQLGRAILLGLEFLVAADIIRTVAVEPTMQNVGVLACIVLIRTFLSWSLELEISGRWPWQKPAEEDGAAAGANPAPPRPTNG